MRRTLFAVTASAGLLALGACGTLGERSTVAQLQERCDRRGGDLVEGGSAAEGGYRCVGVTVNMADRDASRGRSQARGQLSQAVDRGLRGY
ncbi:hypothetical protein [Brevundimonas sp. M20]|uniref:hypothetical protein n=1 Tax=Brevundimonas sp. M20 TaxID=2591463 RepID=UPI0011479F41|nr:hypothetical protein [Brevundimonas sp. M20]QDH73645.1 hypothetical protein FKQ52_09520 [Brevundimonas sp. M20]